MDTYIFNDEGNYNLYKNQYHNFDFSKFCKQYTTEQLTLYREISKEQTTNIINNIKMLQDNIKTMQDNMKNLIKNAVLINEIVE